MKKVTQFLAVLGLSLLFTMAANATVLNFDELEGQDTLPTNYAGLVWGNGWEYYDWVQSPYTAASPEERVYNNIGTPSIAFPTPTVFDGAYFAGYGTAQFDLYLDNLLVATSGALSLSDVPTWLASGYGGTVDYVYLQVTEGYFVMDNFTYNGSTVPEPSTFLLLGAGLGGLALLRRKARQ